MKTERAIEIVRSLADGIDPYTKESIDGSSPYQNADTVRALQVALESLARPKRSRSSSEEGQSKSGKAWTDEDEKLMATMFDAKVNVEEIAVKLERTKGGVWARLEKIGRVSRDANGKVTVHPPVRMEEAAPVPAGAEF